MLECLGIPLDWLSSTELAERLGIDRSNLLKRLKRGSIPAPDLDDRAGKFWSPESAESKK